MISRSGFLVFSVVLFVILASCTKDQVNTFTLPSVYRFNTPSLDSKSIFVIDPGTKNIRMISDTLGSFNRGNKEIADSLNRIILTEFLSERLETVMFNNSEDATLTFGRLDTVGTPDKIVDLKEIKTKYKLSGNQVVFTDFPQYLIFLNNEFLELDYCQELTLRSAKLSTGGSQKKYYKRPCTSDLPRDIVSRIVSSEPGVKYDTISLEYVKYIYSKY
ncbi:MAG: hypothetical protein IPL08_01375 [Saprospiraceae bacterium]|nr:hypothetical protein [Saprospiraceae bacterium]